MPWMQGTGCISCLFIFCSTDIIFYVHRGQEEIRRTETSSSVGSEFFFFNFFNIIILFVGDEKCVDSEALSHYYFSDLLHPSTKNIVHL